MKKHTTAERLMGPWIVDSTECLLDEKAVKQIMVMLFSNNVVTHQIKDLAVSRKSELIPHLQFQVGTRARLASPGCSASCSATWAYDPADTIPKVPNRGTL